MIYTYWLSAVGGLMLLGGIYGWALEPSVDPDAAATPTTTTADPDARAGRRERRSSRTPTPAEVGA